MSTGNLGSVDAKYKDVANHLDGLKQTIRDRYVEKIKKLSKKERTKFIKRKARKLARKTVGRKLLIKTVLGKSAKSLGLGTLVPGGWIGALLWEGGKLAYCGAKCARGCP